MARAVNSCSLFKVLELGIKKITKEGWRCLFFLGRKAWDPISPLCSGGRSVFVAKASGTAGYYFFIHFGYVFQAFGEMERTIVLIMCIIFPLILLGEIVIKDIIDSSINGVVSIVVGSIIRGVCIVVDSIIGVLRIFVHSII